MLDSSRNSCPQPSSYRFRTRPGGALGTIFGLTADLNDLEAARLAIMRLRQAPVVCAYLRLPVPEFRYTKPPVARQRVLVADTVSITFPCRRNQHWARWQLLFI